MSPSGWGQKDTAVIEFCPAPVNVKFQQLEGIAKQSCKIVAKELTFIKPEYQIGVIKILSDQMTLHRVS
jgi:hypothetical protein